MRRPDPVAGQDTARGLGSATAAAQAPRTRPAYGRGTRGAPTSITPAAAQHCFAPPQCCYISSATTASPKPIGVAKMVQDQARPPRSARRGLPPRVLQPRRTRARPTAQTLGAPAARSRELPSDRHRCTGDFYSFFGGCVAGGFPLWLGGYSYLKTRRSVGVRPTP